MFRSTTDAETVSAGPSSGFMPSPRPSPFAHVDCQTAPVTTPDTGPWARESFLTHIISLCRNADSDDLALGAIMNAFPRVGLDDAKLWLAYMKECATANLSPIPFIMDTFRTVSWYKILESSDFGPELVPELSNVAKTLMQPSGGNGTRSSPKQGDAGQRPLSPMSMPQSPIGSLEEPEVPGPRTGSRGEEGERVVAGDVPMASGPRGMVNILIGTISIGTVNVRLP